MSQRTPSTQIPPSEASPHGFYAQWIINLTQCTPNDAHMIKSIMCDHILHTVALDWLTPKEFVAAAGKAAQLLRSDRKVYEEYFGATRAIFHGDHAQQIVRCAQINAS